MSRLEAKAENEGQPIPIPMADEAEIAVAELFKRTGAADFEGGNDEAMLPGEPLGISIMVLSAAIIVPVVEKAGFDLIWFGIQSYLVEANPSSYV